MGKDKEFCTFLKTNKKIRFCGVNLRVVFERCEGSDFIMSEPAKVAFEEILRADEEKKIRQTAQAYQLAYSLTDEPFFCLRNEKAREIGVFIGPSAKKPGQYQATSFGAKGFISNFWGTKQEVILKSTEDFQAFVRDDGILDRLAGNPSFHRNNIRLWYHNRSQDIEMLRDLDISLYAGTHESWQNNEIAIAVRDFSTAYMAARQEKHILIVPGINPHLNAAERESLTTKAVDVLISQGSLNRKNIDIYAKVLRAGDPGMVDAGLKPIKKFIVQRMDQQQSVSPAR